MTSCRFRGVVILCSSVRIIQHEPKACARGRDSEPEKNAVGRPRVKLSDLEPKWEPIMTAIYQEGGTDTEVRIALGTTETYTAFHPDYLKAAAKALDKLVRATAHQAQVHC